MGLPLLTLSGRTFASRMAGSLLTHLGLPELIATSSKEYEDKAVAIAKKTKELDDIRKKLYSNKMDGSLFKMPEFVVNYEECLIKALTKQLENEVELGKAIEKTIEINEIVERELMETNMVGVDNVQINKGLVFDIGANIGGKTLAMLNSGASKIVAVEPQPHLMPKLVAAFGGDNRVVLVGMALSDKVQKLTMSINTAEPTLSTFSDEWKQGRFVDQSWDHEVEIESTTLDLLIAEHGIPEYCKIDVEGFELEVLQGLNIPIPLISFEFTKEFMDNAKKCVERIDTIGTYKYNFTLGEGKKYISEKWLEAHELFSALGKFEHQLLWGDIYAKDINAHYNGDPSRYSIVCNDVPIEPIRKAGESSLSLNDVISVAQQLSDNNKNEEAITLLRSWLKTSDITQSNFVVFYNLSVYLQQIGSDLEAESAARQCVYFHPSFLQGHLLLGKIIEKQGRFNESITQWLQALARPVSNAYNEKQIRSLLKDNVTRLTK
jgi:FkbM family methyltransferase